MAKKIAISMPDRLFKKIEETKPRHQGRSEHICTLIENGFETTKETVFKKSAQTILARGQ